MKTSTIENIKSKEFNQQYKKWSHNLKLANGDEGFLSCAKEYNAGDEIEYLIEEKTSKAGKSYFQISLPSAPKTNGYGFKSQPQSKDSSFALSYAKDLTVAMLTHDLIPNEKMNSTDIAKGTIHIANEFLKWLKEN